MGTRTITLPTGPAGMPHDPKTAFAVGFGAEMSTAGWVSVGADAPLGGTNWTTYTTACGHREYVASFDHSADVLLIWHGRTGPDVFLHASERGVRAAVDRMRELRVLPPARL